MPSLSTRSVFCLARIALAVCLLAALLPASLPAAASPAAASLAATAALPEKLPVFQLVHPPIQAADTLALSQAFDTMTATQVMTTTSHLDTPLIRAFSPSTGILLEQHQGSRGFFAFNPERAFREEPTTVITTPQAICTYLHDHDLFPAEVAPHTRDCKSNDLLYTNSPIKLSTLQLPAPGVMNLQAGEVITTTEVIGHLWQVPLALNVDPYLPNPTAPLYVPLGGPGGHLSLLIAGEEGSRDSLDSALPGLQALAVPSYQLNKILIGLYPVIQPGDARLALQAQLSSQLPGAQLDAGTPQLLYYLEDPAELQKALLPVWAFPDATALIDGQIVPLRGIHLPAIEGFIPTIQITSPKPGHAIYPPSLGVEVEGNISLGKPPYITSLELEDGTVLGAGATGTGYFKYFTGPLPRDERPDTPGVLLILKVTDKNGASTSASVLVHTHVHDLFTPILRRAGPTLAVQSSLLPPGLPAWELQAQQPTAAPQIIRKMGVQYVMNYNGLAGDLKLTQADAQGFYNRMIVNGWTGMFNYGNNNAWERDWRDCALGGGDCKDGVELAEFVFFSGHGGPSKIYFGVSKDSPKALASNARFHNLRWAAFSTCQTLRAGPYIGPGNPPLTEWFSSFQGSYMLFGYHSNMWDFAIGQRFAYNATNAVFLQYRLRDAWVMTAFQTAAGKPAYLYAVGNVNPEDKKLPDTSVYLPPLLPHTITHFRWMWWE
jgi:hypothetical protein